MGGVGGGGGAYGGGDRGGKLFGSRTALHTVKLSSQNSFDESHFYRV